MLPSQFDRLIIPREKVLARLGYARGKTALDPRTDALINEETAVARQLINGRQAIACSKVRCVPPDRCMLEPELVIQSTNIFQLLQECSAAYGFAVTIGPALEEKRACYLAAKETGRAVVLDAIGSVAAEELAERTHRQLAAQAASEGGALTRRFSPGYGDWALAGQQEFLRWIGADAINIRLTGHFQMVPEKSVTAIVGIKSIKAGIHEKK